MSKAAMPFDPAVTVTPSAEPTWSGGFGGGKLAYRAPEMRRGLAARALSFVDNRLTGNHSAMAVSKADCRDRVPGRSWPRGIS